MDIEPGVARTQPEETNPFVIFPHEVWEGIVYTLKDTPETAWNLIRAYPQLREKVIKKAEVLFHKVLPLIFPELEKANFLACRRVSKWWRNAVDHFLVSSYTHKPYSLDNETVPEVKSLAEKDMQFMVQRYNTSLAKMVRAKTEAPFGTKAPTIVGNSLAFVHRTQPQELPESRVDLTVWYNSLLPFLELFGQTIHFVSVPFSSTVHTSEDMPNYEELVRCLNLLPALKALTCSMPVRYSAMIGIYPERPPWVEAHQRLVQQMATLPLPPQPNLKYLRLRGTIMDRGSLPMRVVMQVLRFYGPQLEKLELDKFYWELPLGNDILLPNVTELTLWGPRFRENVLSLLAEALGFDKLRKLELRFEFGCLPKVLELFEGFPHLEVVVMDWFPSSPSLALQWRVVEHEIAAKFLAVRVLKVRLLHSEHLTYFPNLKVLTCFPELEYLEFCIVKRLTTAEPDQFERKLRACVLRLQDDQMDISVWELFPKLKRFVVNGEKFSRI